MLLNFTCKKERNNFYNSIEFKETFNYIHILMASNSSTVLVGFIMFFVHISRGLVRLQKSDQILYLCQKKTANRKSRLFNRILKSVINIVGYRISAIYIKGDLKHPIPILITLQANFIALFVTRCLKQNSIWRVILGHTLGISLRGLPLSKSIRRTVRICKKSYNTT